jgi:hypothetical protein
MAGSDRTTGPRRASALEFENRQWQPKSLDNLPEQPALLPTAGLFPAERDQDVVRREGAEGVLERGDWLVTAHGAATCCADLLDVAEDSLETLVCLATSLVRVRHQPVELLRKRRGDNKYLLGLLDQ